MSYFEQLNKLCRQRKTTPTAVSVKLGVGKGAMSQWKKGSIPNGETLIKLADYLDTSTDYLLGRTENPYAPPKGNVNKNIKEIEQMDDETLRFNGLEIHEKIKAIRKERRMTIEEVSARLGAADYFSYETNAWRDKNIGGASYDTLSKIKAFYNDPSFDIHNNDNYDTKFLEKHLREGEFLPNEFSLAIKRGREQKGLSEKELADKLGLEEISIISWESGERIPSDVCYKLLAAELGLTLHYATNERVDKLESKLDEILDKINLSLEDEEETRKASNPSA